MKVPPHRPVVHMKIRGTALILIIQVRVAVSSAAEGNLLGDTESIHHHPMLEVVVLMGLNLLTA